MLRLLLRLFALTAAAAFAGSMALFALAWLGLPPLSLQRQATLPTGAALAIDLALLAAFGLHHSLMARDRAKALLMKTRAIGEEEAYAMMRRAAMNQKARLGDIARAIITASEIC